MTKQNTQFNAVAFLRALRIMAYEDRLYGSDIGDWPELEARVATSHK